MGEKMEREVDCHDLEYERKLKTIGDTVALEMFIRSEMDDEANDMAETKQKMERLDITDIYEYLSQCEDYMDTLDAALRLATLTGLVRNVASPFARFLLFASERVFFRVQSYIPLKILKSLETRGKNEADWERLILNYKPC